MALLKLSQFPSVAANAVSTLNLAELRGYSVHGLIFEQSGGAFDKTHLSEIKFTLGSKPLFHGITGSQLQDLNDYNGYSATTNYLAYWFGDPTAKTIFGQHLTDLDLDYYQDFAPVLEVSIGAATTPGLQMYALVGPPKAQMGLGYSEADIAMTRAMIRSVLTPNAAVTKQSYQIGLGSNAGAAIRQLAFFHANLTKVEFKKSGFVLHDDVSDALNDFVQKEFARVPQAGLYVLDNIIDGNQGKAEQTVDRNGRPFPMQVNLTTSGGDTITTFADVRAPLQLL